MSTPNTVSFPVRMPAELKAQISSLSIALGISEQDIMRLCLRIGLTDIESIKKDHSTLVKEAADECGSSFASWAKNKSAAAAKPAPLNPQNSGKVYEFPSESGLKVAEEHQKDKGYDGL